MSESKITSESGDFFNEKQKEVKGQIMQNLMDGFFHPFAKNKELFPDIQSVTDLFGSILVMFNRDLLVHMLTHGGLTNNRKDIMKNLFAMIKDQVNEKVKKKMM